MHTSTNFVAGRFVQSDAIVYLRGLPDDAVLDVVWVDDWHSRDHVTQEIELLASHVTNTRRRGPPLPHQDFSEL